MTSQEMVDHFARIAKPRLLDLLKLKVPHIYDGTPGDASSKSTVEKMTLGLKLTSTVQRYASIERFVDKEKLMGFVVNPGLIPIVKAISLEVRGRQLLVTKRISARNDDNGFVAHMDGFGVRLLMQEEADGKDTRLIWEALYGAA
jgi:hypothetical protein